MHPQKQKSQLSAHSSVGSVASVSCQAGCDTPPHGPYEASQVVLGDVGPFLLQSCHHLLSVLWGWSPVGYAVSKLIPKVLDWRQVWRISWPREDGKPLILQEILCYTSSVRACVVLLESGDIGVVPKEWNNYRFQDLIDVSPGRQIAVYHN